MNTMHTYGKLCTQFYDLDKPTAPPEALAFYLKHARQANGAVLEAMCGSGRFLIPMTQAFVNNLDFKFCLRPPPVSIRAAQCTQYRHPDPRTRAFGCSSGF